MPKIPIGSAPQSISAILQQALYGKKKSAAEMEKERQKKRLDILLGIMPR